MWTKCQVWIDIVIKGCARRPNVRTRDPSSPQCPHPAVNYDFDLQIGGWVWAWYVPTPLIFTLSR
jgi:hypothetical protein